MDWKVFWKVHGRCLEGTLKVFWKVHGRCCANFFGENNFFENILGFNFFARFLLLSLSSRPAAPSIHQHINLAQPSLWISPVDSGRIPSYKGLLVSLHIYTAMSSSSVTPVDILSSDQCKIQSLTVSDQHATLLISHLHTSINAGNTTDSEEHASNNVTLVQSLLKLTIVPFHKTILGCNPALTQEDIDNGQPPERNVLHHDQEASLDILAFLKGFDFELKSSSGAEYSYYIAKPKDIHGTNSTAAAALKSDSTSQGASKDHELQLAKEAFGSFDVELICPASSTTAPNLIL